MGKTHRNPLARANRFVSIILSYSDPRVLVLLPGDLSGKEEGMDGGQYGCHLLYLHRLLGLGLCSAIS